jgi:hypothetical protein
MIWPVSMERLLLETDVQDNTRRTRQGRVGVDVIHAVELLTRQSRPVVVIDVGDPRVEEIESLGGDSCVLVETQADLTIPD